MRIFILLALLACMPVLAGQKEKRYGTDINTRSSNSSQSGAISAAGSKSTSEVGLVDQSSQEVNNNLDVAGPTTEIQGNETNTQSGGNQFDAGDNETNVFSLSLESPNIDGCIAGGSVGGSGDGGGAIIQWNGLIHDCWMEEVSKSERHIEARARLKCGSKRVRNAIAYHLPRRERQSECIRFFVRVWAAEIDYLVGLEESTNPK